MPTARSARAHEVVQESCTLEARQEVQGGISSKAETPVPGGPGCCTRNPSSCEHFQRKTTSRKGIKTPKRRRQLPPGTLDPPSSTEGAELPVGQATSLTAPPGPPSWIGHAFAAQEELGQGGSYTWEDRVTTLPPPADRGGVIHPGGRAWLPPRPANQGKAILRAPVGWAAGPPGMATPLPPR